MEAGATATTVGIIRKPAQTQWHRVPWVHPLSYGTRGFSSESPLLGASGGIAFPSPFETWEDMSSITSLWKQSRATVLFCHCCCPSYPPSNYEPHVQMVAPKDGETSGPWVTLQELSPLLTHTGWIAWKRKEPWLSSALVRRGMVLRAAEPSWFGLLWGLSPWRCPTSSLEL